MYKNKRVDGKSSSAPDESHPWRLECATVKYIKASEIKTGERKKKKITDDARGRVMTGGSNTRSTRHEPHSPGTPVAKTSSTAITGQAAAATSAMVAQHANAPPTNPEMAYSFQTYEMWRERYHLKNASFFTQCECC